jgi:hypothetical protein
MGTMRFESCAKLAASCLLFLVVLQPGRSDEPDYSKPGPEHKKLDVLLGEWDWTAKLWAEPGKEPVEFKGTAVRKWILDGKFIQEDVRSTVKEFPFTGMGLVGYDRRLKKYVTVWVDSENTEMPTSTGRFDEAGKVLTFEREGINPYTGKKAKFRDIARFLDKDRFTSEMLVTDEGGKEVKLLELNGIRKK